MRENISRRRRSPISCCALISLILLFLSIASLRAQELKSKVVVVKEDAVLRVSASEDSPILRKIPVGTILEVEQTGWDWLKVKLPPDTSGIRLVGYIHVQFVSYEVEKFVKPEEKKVVVPPKEVPVTKPVTPPTPPPPQPKEPAVEKKKEVGIPVAVPRHRVISLYAGKGWDHINGGDLNRMIRDTNQFYADSNDYFDFIEYISDWGEFSWGGDVRGEIIFNFSPAVGIGLGVDYINDFSKGTLTQEQDTETTVNTGLGYYYVDKVVYSSNIEPDYRIRVFPVSLNLHLSMPITSLFTAFLTGGISYYFGSLKVNIPYQMDFGSSLKYYYDDDTFWHEWIDNQDQTGTYTAEAHSGGLGFQAGAGLDLKVTRNISFIIEGLYRTADLREWKGSSLNAYTWNTESGWSDGSITTLSGSESEPENGNLWYYELYYDYLQKYYAKMGISGVAPAPGIDIRNIRLAVISLTGFILRWGIRVNF